MSTVDKLNKVLETKEAIKQAIIDKGGTVGDIFAEYPTAIQNIQCGGGSGKLVIPAGMKLGYSTFTEFPEDWDWSEVENGDNTNYMFFSNLNLVNSPVLKLKNVKELISMYQGCKQLKTVDTSKWDTSNVTSMKSIFYECSNLETLDISNFDMSNVTSVNSMFSNCTNLNTINFGVFDTSSCSDFASVFYRCNRLKSIPEINASANKSNYTKYSSPVSECYALRNFGGLKGINKTWYVDSAYSLSYESLLNIINGLADGVSGQTLYLAQDLVNQLSDEDIAIATNKGWTISPAKTITEPIVVTELSQIPSSTKIITPKTYDLSQYTGRLGRADNYKSYLPSIYFFDGDISKAEDVDYAFAGIPDLRYTILKTNIAGSTHSMFRNCPSLTEVTGLEGYTTNANYMFYICRDLRFVDLSKLDISQCTSMINMFAESGIENAPEMDTRSVSTMEKMFYKCENLINFPQYNTQSVTSMSYMFNSAGITTADLRGWDLSKVASMNYMFEYCTNLTSVIMDSELNPGLSCPGMFSNITTTGTFYYNPAYDYSRIISVLPATWTAVPLTE